MTTIADPQQDEAAAHMADPHVNGNNSNHETWLRPSQGGGALEKTHLCPLALGFGGKTIVNHEDHEGDCITAAQIRQCKAEGLLQPKAKTEYLAEDLFQHAGEHVVDEAAHADLFWDPRVRAQFSESTGV